MAVNVTNIEGLIRGYVINNIQKNFPDLDLTENSAYDDLFVKPIAKLFLPLFEKLNSMEMKLNLDNAEYMTEDELDEVGQGNYFMTRKDGKKATTVLTLSFANVLEGETIIVPAGIIFQTSDAIQFQTASRISFSYEEILPFFNTATSNYDIPVAVEAVGIGINYNVGPNTITVCTVLFNTNLISVTNENAVTDGSDKATNIEYAKQIKNFYISRQLGTDPGYKAFITENFDEVEDVYVAGYKNQYMIRDIIKVYSQETQTYIDKHIGGMVDLYIKGCNYSTENTDIPLQTNFFLLSQDYSSINQSTISVLNNTDATKTPVILSKTSYDLNGKAKLAIVLDNTGEKSFSNSSDSQIYIVYDYTDSDGVSQNQIDSFIVGETKAELSAPVKEVVSLSKSGQIIDNISSHYTLIKGGDIDTTKETCSIKLSGFDSYPNGTVITVSYAINLTLKSIGSVFDKEEYRIVTADILAKEAKSSLVNMYIQIKMNSGYTLDKIKISKIRSSLNSFFEGKSLGSSIEESDIVNWLTTDDNIKDFIDYIALPFTAFYIADNASDPLQNIRTGTKLLISEITYPILNKFDVTEIK
jgi:hypothetical protein